MLVGWFAARIGMELASLRDYIDAMSLAIQRGEDSLSEIAKYGEESREHLADYFSEEAYQWREVFPAMLWASFFMAMYSFLECQMTAICIHVTSMEQHDVWVKKQGHMSTLGKNRKYLNDEAGITFCSDEEWDELDVGFRETRNALTHNGGNIAQRSSKKLTREELQDFIVARGGSVDATITIGITKEFCANFEVVVCKSLRRLLEKLPQKA